MSSGCSDDSIGGGLSTVCIGFIPDATCSGAQVVAREGAGTTCDDVDIEFVVQGDGSVTDVFGGKFTLGYDVSHSFFSSVSDAGSFLLAACSVSKTACLSANDCPSGELCQPAGVIVAPSGGSISGSTPVAITRSGVLTGVTPTASQNLLVTVTMGRFGVSGSVPLTLTNTALFDPGAPPQPKAGITFCGGTLVIQ